MLQNADGSLQQPTVTERERALGLPAGATAAPGLSDADRHDLTGRSIDLHALTVVLHAAAVVATANPMYSAHQSVSPVSPVCPVHASCSMSSCPVQPWPVVAALPTAVPHTHVSGFPFFRPTWPVSFSSTSALPPKPDLQQPPPYSLRPVSFRPLAHTPTSAQQARGMGETGNPSPAAT